MGHRKTRRKGVGEPKTSPRSAQSELQRQEIAELRAKGMSLTEIAQRTGYAHRASVYKQLVLFYHNRPSEAVEVMRAEENDRMKARIEHLTQKFYATDEIDEVCKLSAELLKIEARYARLNGLDAPVKAPVGPDGRPVPAQITVIYEDRPMPPIIDVTNVSDSHQITQVA